MPTRPEVSIVLATNRSSRFLPQAIDSVRQQTHSDWELIVVDNGVPDSDVLHALVADDPRCRVVSAAASFNQGGARNIGAAHSLGAIIAFADDDDAWHPDRLTLLADALGENPAATCAFSAYRHIDASGRAFGTDWRSRPSSRLEMLSGVTDTPLGPSMIIRRDAFDAAGGYSPEIPLLEDFELALRLLLQGPFIYRNEVLFDYRRHDFNITSLAPENVAVRREAMDLIVARQLWAARARGEVETAEALARRLRRTRREAAHASGEGALRALRHHSPRVAAKEAAWALRTAPGSYVRGLAHSVMSQLRLSSR